ncbi:zinc finger protein 556-like isoform X2 [Anoplopoma fimbria]|uniref:zinc finger protein 556-like isoform X2 n=1 Tax=Anoplopoma fimbria TaxID=229290 RepID=UPI0023EB62C2|nr:zinc finger protein 556-like isoform X2 [Anoplopoma fimbria]
MCAVQGSPVPRGVSCSADASNAFVSGEMQPKHMDFDLIGEKAALLQMKGKYVVNEKRLLQLFRHKCPSCGSKVKMEKVTYGLLIILNQQCLQCDYRNQWKSQVNASVPTAENQHLTEVVEVTPQTQQAVPTGVTGVHEIVAVIDEESEPIDESSDQGDLDSDEDWKPVNGSSRARVLIKKPKGETEEEEEEEDDSDEEEDEEEDGDYPPLPVKHSRLCTECGVLYNKQRPHTCEHKIRPFSCNICGKRCVSDKALITHSRIHDENYEYQCKYCHATFKTKVDKITHEQIHVIQGKPYKCPDCPESFATNKERRIHLEDHRGPQQLKCHICGIDFLWPLSLQRHLAVHTGDRPFKCSVCQRGFKQAGHLKSHMRLHTGERPYKCQLCDKSFNHNVSLKSHVQRYHSPGSGRERMKEKLNKRASDTGDAQDYGNNRGADSGLDNVEDEQDTEEEAQREITYRPKKKSTGRPIGRPKRHEPGNIAEGQSSNTKSGRLQAQRSKRTQCRDEESEAKPSDSGTSFDSAEEEEESCRDAKKNTVRSRGRPDHSDSDCDFDPEERKKRRYSSQSSGKSSGKRRGRPRRNPKDDS